MSEKPILEAVGIGKTFGKTVAVKEVNLRIAKGECVAMLGPNGAGKTTTVEMLEGLLTPDRGTIRIGGYDFSHNRVEILEFIGVLLQETYLYKKFTVRETVELFAGFYSKPVNVEDLLKRLMLSDKADSRLESLSGGLKQRAYLACALVNNPTLVFLDEPTTGLDPHARRMTWELIEEIKAEGRSILLTTHYMEEAQVLADRVAIMDDGAVIAEGSPKELIQKLRGERFLRFSIANNRDDQESVRVKLATEMSWLSSLKIKDTAFEVLTAEPLAKIQELFRFVDQNQWSLHSFEVRECTLEDVYLTLTGKQLRDK